MIKNKVCKSGNGKAVDFDGCGKSLPIEKYGKSNFKYGLGISCGCYSKWLLGTKEGLETLDKSRLKAHKEVATEKKRELREKKLAIKSIAALIQDARRPFQKLIRIRDHGQNCICCDKPLPFNIGEYDGGHFKKAEVYSGLIFHPDNINGQLVYCNKHQHGNEGAYSIGLIKRIGQRRYDELIKLSIKFKSYSWDRNTLIEMKAYYTKELRLVEKGLKDITDVDLSIGIPI